MSRPFDVRLMLRKLFEFCDSQPFCFNCPLNNHVCGKVFSGNAPLSRMVKLCNLAGIELPTEIESESEPMTNDIIAHPSHYTEGRKFEPKDVIRDWGLNFNLGSAVKYISRAGRKDDILQDLKKARQFLDFEIEAIEEERKETKNETD